MPKKIRPKGLPFYEAVLWDLQNKVEVGDCWVWHGLLDRSGYARFGHLGKWTGAHRAVWTALVGTIPSGLDIDHLCRNHPCVNPDHLQPVTRRVNVLRGATVAAINSRKDFCNKGHKLSGENLRIRAGKGGRVCKACDREAARKAYKPRPKRTHCSKGHPYSGDNLLTYPSKKRVCRTCQYARGVVAYEKRKQRKRQARTTHEEDGAYLEEADTKP